MNATVMCVVRSRGPIALVAGVVAVVMTLMMSGAASADDVSTSRWASTSNNHLMGNLVGSPSQNLYWQGTGEPAESLFDLKPTVGSGSIAGDLKDAVANAEISTGEDWNPWLSAATIAVSTVGAYAAYHLQDSFFHWISSFWGAAPSSSTLCGDANIASSACQLRYLQAGASACIGSQSNGLAQWWTVATSGYYAESSNLGNNACGAGLRLISLAADNALVSSADSIFGASTDTGIHAPYSSGDFLVWGLAATLGSPPSGMHSDYIGPYTGQGQYTTMSCPTNCGTPQSDSTLANALRKQITGLDDTCGNSSCSWGSAGLDQSSATTIQTILDDIIGGSSTTPLTPTFTMPDCSGYLASDCEALITSAADGAGGVVPAFIVSSGSSDASRLPGAIVSQGVTAGSSTNVGSLSLTANPDPMNGFPSSGGDSGRNDDGSRVTGGGEEECDFDDFAQMPSWATLTDPSYPESQAYLDACTEGWSVARQAGYVDAFDNPTAWAYAGLPQLDVRVPGMYFYDAATVDALTADGSAITDWVKISSPQFETPEGPAEMHVYRNIKTGQLNLSRGWKLIFKNPF
jgi:hypothetical protein